MANYKTVICFFPNAEQYPKDLRFVKYRNVTNLDSLKRYCEKSGAAYFNVYDKKTKQFLQRIYI